MHLSSIVQARLKCGKNYQTITCSLVRLSLDLDNRLHRVTGSLMARFKLYNSVSGCDILLPFLWQFSCSCVL
jgi:hypothetical protein